MRPGRFLGLISNNEGGVEQLSAVESNLPLLFRVAFSFYCATHLHSADYAMARCLSVCLSRAGIVPKRLHVLKVFTVG